MATNIRAIQLFKFVRVVRRKFIIDAGVYISFENHFFASPHFPIIFSPRAQRGIPFPFPFCA